MRFAVGIDLGTSNTALAYADLNEQDPQVRVFEVPQLTAAQTTQPRPLLPSHLYLPSEHEALGSEPLVGIFARERGAQVPGRHVASAKSWLCHPSVDRTAKILPWGAPPEVQRLSPVAASSQILVHLRRAWDAAHPEAPLAEQDVVVTVPASFDEGARALTLQAAAEAGLPKLLLVEEPQAAFYDWVRVHRGRLFEELQDVKLVLVVDVGGGTTDLTLIKTAVAEDQPPVLERIAVGDHLLLGGDNMDLALARTAEARLGRKLDASQFGALVSSCRAAKELLLREDAPDRTAVTVPGGGSRLVGGSLTVELLRDEARALLLDGFFPQVAAADAPVKASRATGLAELGLPYAADPAITRHAAAFVQRHAQTAGQQRVDAVLYNGGALAPALLADRLTQVVSSWHGPVKRLRNDAPDLAVARGAATYALVRRGLGLRIGGGSPRTYYAGVGDQAVCLVPRGAAEGAPQPLARDFSLVLGRPVRFRLFSASNFRKDQPGDLVPIDEDLAELPPLQTVIPGEGTAPVRLKATLTEIGTLEVFCEGSSTWKLEFQLRSDSREAGGVSQLPRTIEAAREVIGTVFGKKPVQDANVKDLWRNLEKTLGDRSSWTLATLRDLWGVLWAGASKRRRTPDHERIFLALCGFLLRPGFGAPLDGWRAEQTFSLFGQGLTHHKDAAVWAAWWILWRRTAAGLPEAAHLQLFEAVAPHLRPKPTGRVANPGKKPPGLATDEMVRLLGALERLPISAKVEAGGWLLSMLAQPGVAWALGRLGARVPVAGAAQSVVPPEVAAQWLAALLAQVKQPEAQFAIAQIARLSGDRSRDLDEELRARAAAALEKSSAPPDWSRAIREVQALGEKDEQRVFGESLPLGLHLAG
ncbi:MAG TPA: Hsp70 family protein [Myxococcales bacterium]|nr:Hsp70 family protein [Myxococcales bacterium]